MFECGGLLERHGRTRLQLTIGLGLTVALACSGCSSSGNGSNAATSTTAADAQVVATAIRNESLVESGVIVQQSEVTTTTRFVDTNGTDPDPERSEPRPAFWTVDPATPPTEESTSVQLLVTERACASGIAPTGRIQATVEYTSTEVIVAVVVNTVGGDVDCQGVGPFPFTLQLTEPLGDRTIVGEDPVP